ncbi:hypothetical protein L207DRAFT_536030 [Hyaloscypha variabilis F]|uniref:Uncharacterized protein n=1 Tax=Hyaloscypha variabilis (strain UAMH 11265 / GT02V1 / F) TaxID=1149755 RepID=A0A2J6R2I7_HYAVF|nr:hypothetical protein L207DRAFT_536030 [Hyaloscypha variabilis F]
MSMLEEIDNEDLLELRRDVIIPNPAPMVTRSDNQQRYFQNCRFIVAGLVEYCRSEFDEDGPLAFKMHRWLHVAPEEMEETKVALIDRLTYNHVDSTILAAQEIMGRVDYTPEMMEELPETDWKETRVWGNYGGVVRNITGVGPHFGIYAGASTAKPENGSTWKTAGAMSNRWYYHYQNIGKGLVALEEAQREANRKALMGERKQRRARTGFELSLRLLRTYESLGTEIPTKSSILAKKLKPTMLLEHSFEPLNRELPARQGFRGLQSTGPCIECKAIQPHPYPEKLKTPITQWYRHPNSGQAHRTLCGLFLLQPSKAEEDAAFGWSLDERIHEGVAGGQLCKTCYDRFGIQSRLLDLTKLEEKRFACSYFKCSGKAVKKKGPLWFDHPEDIDKVPIAEYRSVCATCFGKIHKKDLPRHLARDGHKGNSCG